jgi:hypothetical protein
MSRWRRVEAVRFRAAPGALGYRFPAQTILDPDGYLVVAKDPDRLLGVAAYHLPAASIFGPWQGQLNNAGDNTTIMLQFMTAPGRSYTIESCDLLNAYPWRKLADIPAQPGPRSIVIKDDAGTATDARFYRLVTPQAE